MVITFHPWQPRIRLVILRKILVLIGILLTFIVLITALFHTSLVTLSFRVIPIRASYMLKKTLCILYRGIETIFPGSKLQLRSLRSSPKSRPALCRRPGPIFPLQPSQQRSSRCHSARVGTGLAIFCHPKTLCCVLFFVLSLSVFLCSPRRLAAKLWESPRRPEEVLSFGHLQWGLGARKNGRDGLAGSFSTVGAWACSSFCFFCLVLLTCL